MRKVLLSLFMLLSFSVFAQFAEVVHYHLSCNITVTVYYVNKQPDAALEAYAHVFNQIYCDNPGRIVSEN